MKLKEEALYLSAVILCLMIGPACGQDWLVGGYVGSYTGDIGIYFNDPIFYTNPIVGQKYQSQVAIYPWSSGVFPYSPMPYYSDFRLSSLAGMNWTPIQINWSDTMQNAITKSSFRTYPIRSDTIAPVQLPGSSSLAPSYPNVQPGAAQTGDSTATIISQGMRGYQVFLDGNYIGTEGTGGDPSDGKFSFSVVGNQNHEIRVFDGQFNYPKTMFFERGGTKIINVEAGTAVYL